jgi:hypothetical protein
MAVEWKKIAFADDLHAAVTIDGTSPLSLDGQAISLKNDAAAAITKVDTGALGIVDTTIPTSLTVAERMPNRNAIINGAMDIWQRGTSFAGAASGSFSADRFHIVQSTSAVVTMSQNTETPSVGFPFRYSLKMDCTTADTDVAAGDSFSLRYNVEGYDFKRFEGETATLSFWAKAVKAGTYCVAFRNSAADKSYVHEYTLAANIWTKVTFTLTFNSGGTFLYTTGIGLRIQWMIMCGSTYQTATTDAWVTGSYLATSNQVNSLDSTSNDFYLTGVQLELGSVATPFEVKPFADELARCQRYYEKSYQVPVVPGTTANYTVFQQAASTSLLPGSTFRVTKRAAPTLTIYSALGTVARVSDGVGSDIGAENILPQHVHDYGYAYIAFPTTGPLTTGSLYFYNWVAVSEL